MAIWQIKESSEELRSLFADESSYSTAISGIKAEKRHQEKLACRLLIKELLGKEVRLANRPDGSPYLPDEPYHISISHTNGYAAVLLHHHTEAGIDIEFRSDRVRKVRSRFMSEEEEMCIDPDHETEHLLLHWCAKEALFKMIGRAGIDFIRHLHVKNFPYSESGEMEVYETSSGTSIPYILQFKVEREFVLAYSLDC